MPKISVIVPVYKVEPYLHRCVDSIVNQTFIDFELILVDDGSPDNCGKICDEYAEKDNRVIVIHKKNGGLSDARNAGIDWAFANSDSEWLTFIDSDDWVHKNYLELLYEAAIKNNVKISSCEHITTNSKFEDVEIQDYSIDIDHPENLLVKRFSFCQYNFSVAWARLYKKELFKNIRYPFGKLHEDEFVTHKLIYCCETIAVLKVPLYYYFQNNNGIMASPINPIKMNDRFESVRIQIAFFYEKKCPVSFVRALKNFSTLFQTYFDKYGHEKQYDSIFKEQLNQAKLFKKKYADYLPSAYKKYGYKKWMTGKYLKIENFKNDVRSVKMEKGFFYSILWAIKNGLKK